MKICEPLETNVLQICSSLEQVVAEGQGFDYRLQGTLMVLEVNLALLI